MISQRAKAALTSVLRLCDFFACWLLSSKCMCVWACDIEIYIYIFSYKLQGMIVFGTGKHWPVAALIIILFLHCIVEKTRIAFLSEYTCYIKVFYLLFPLQQSVKRCTFNRPTCKLKSRLLRPLPKEDVTLPFTLCSDFRKFDRKHKLYGLPQSHQTLVFVMKIILFRYPKLQLPILLPITLSNSVRNRNTTADIVALKSVLWGLRLRWRTVITNA